MGDPRKTRSTYRSPSHPWNKERLVEEDSLLREYGIKNKKEIWKMESILQDFKHQSKKLVAMQTKQAEVEKSQLISRLKSLGLLKEGQGFDDILGLQLKDILERRLATIVLRKALTKTVRQARQFIAYGHINIGQKEITSPSYLVTISEESSVCYNPRSALADPNHPDRVISEKKPKVKKERREDPRQKRFDKKKNKRARQ
jgi:small subunit ribosomal protein S4